MAGGRLLVASVANGNDSLDAGGKYVGAAGTAAIGASDLIRPGDFSGLHDRYVSWREYIRPREAREDLEAEWGAEAQRERQRRSLSGLAFTIVGAAIVGWGVTSTYSDSTGSSRHPSEVGPAIAWAAVGAEITTFGIYWLATKGPIESALHDYERSTGRIASPQAEARLSVRPFLAPAPGGGVAGFVGEF